MKSYLHNDKKIKTIKNKQQEINIDKMKSINYYISFN